MCIYLGEQPHLHYDSAEHIIPAGLGGMQRLPLDYVSREFNHTSSKKERAFMQSSIIALPRQILGPGKRGSLNPTRATKSRVSVFSKQPDEEAFSLGYIQRGMPYELPYIAWNAERDEFTISIPKGATEAEVSQFKGYLETFDEKRARLIAFPQLDSSTYLLGVQPGLEHNVDFYIASHDGHTHAFTQELLDEINSLIADKGTFSGEEKYHVKTHQSALIGVDYYTCCAKIAFNTLAYLKGKDYVLQECFDPLREWIVNGGDNRFVEIAPGMLAGMRDYFPVDSHYIYFTKSGNALFADVCFYNYFHNTVRLSEKLSGDFSLDGFICDWRGRQELRLHKYITQQAANPDGASA